MMKVGDKVNYHSVIGGPVTSRNHTVEYLKKQPHKHSCATAKISGKSEWVPLQALSYSEYVGGSAERDANIIASTGA